MASGVGILTDVCLFILSSGIYLEIVMFSILYHNGADIESREIEVEIKITFDKSKGTPR